MGIDLSGRHVVVTGASGGLGGAVVEALLAAGASCHAPLRKPTPEPWAARVRVTPGVDLTSEAAVEGYYAGLPPLWASIHLAGGFSAAAITSTRLGDLRAQLDINLVTAFLCCREAVRNMRGAGAGGRIVNVASRAALVPAGGTLAYTAAKGALAAFTQGLAQEVRADGILVNAVAPALFDTPSNRAAMPAADHARWPKPAEVAAPIVWLASPENQLTSGALLPT